MEKTINRQSGDKSEKKKRYTETGEIKLNRIREEICEKEGINEYEIVSSRWRPKVTFKKNKVKEEDTNFFHTIIYYNNKII